MTAQDWTVAGMLTALIFGLFGSILLATQYGGERLLDCRKAAMAANYNAADINIICQ